MSYLVDTNVISEIRKGSRADPSVMTWWQSSPETEIYLSVIVISELFRGIEKLMPVDPNRAQEILNWLQSVIVACEGRILVIDVSVATAWGKLTSKRSLPLADAMLAATALTHDLTLVTRNIRDFESTGIRCINPFDT